MKLSERYKIKQSLGVGRLGHAYLAQDIQSSDEVIVREFDLSKINDRVVFEKQFHLLVSDLTSVQAEGVLPILSADIEDDLAYIVSASAEGVTVKNLLGLEEFKVEEVYDMAMQLLQSLAKFSEMGFFHYHFRLSSVLVRKKQTGEKRFMLMDMGYSKLLPMMHGVGAEQSLIDSAFAAPELCNGEPMGEITSLFMVGQLCYAMLAGCHPLADLPLDLAIAKHKVGELPHINGLRVNVPEGFKLWMYKLMRPDWRERPQSIQEALDYLPIRDLMCDLEVNVVATKPLSEALPSNK